MTYRHRVGVVCVVVLLGGLLLAAWATGTWSGDRLYAFAQIQGPGAARRTVVSGLNDHGDLVGWYQDAAGVVHGYLRTHGQFSPVAHPDAAPGTTIPRDLNNAQAIVGDYVDAAGTTHGFVLAHGVYTTLDVPGATFTRATTISETGTVWGVSIVADGTAPRFRYRHGVYTTVTLPEEEAAQQAIAAYLGVSVTQVTLGGTNRRGEFVGDVLIPHVDPPHPLLGRGFYYNGHTVQLLHAPHAVRTHATDINRRGQIVGHYVFGPTPVIREQYGFVAVQVE